MDGKGIIGIGVVIVMGIIIGGIVMMFNSTIGDLDEKCKSCGDNCTIKSCNNNSSSNGKIFSYGLIGVYIISAIGILYFSLKKDEPVTKNETLEDYQNAGQDYSYG